ncbi:hypothetical protein KP509_21G087900 [Ceratopteris richardii]|uniref:Uncharacterized protein n=1 Tax=Ceratopteris richardii TaxID=49495 RepID=A0A8T2SF76_CERRI|nr:hypothetical protein KP509_21G087900 [Ceratopteris richardii]
MEPQKCLYEILGVEPTASNEEIRTAYRKLALKWHPDKIQQSGASAEAREDATIRFQEIGRAYEVLADPSERSWYDSHRSQILSGSTTSSSTFDFNPWPYFSASIFSGYGDSGKGFYAVYGELFKTLHKQEMSFAQAYGLRTPPYPPDMGNLSTSYTQVQTFYNHWLGFSTVKDFVWCDEYRASSGPNRKIRRLMEEENKKIRSKARREFNEAIRNLAAFVKKRDKRVLERQVEVQRIEKEKEEIRKARRRREEEEKRMKARLYEEAAWTKVESDHDAEDGSDFDENMGSYTWGQSDTKASSSKTNMQDEFFCVVCNKKFKSDKQWENHERSKKHLEKVAILKESFEEDDKELQEILHGHLQNQNDNTQTKGSVENHQEGEKSPDMSDTSEAEIMAESPSEANVAREASALDESFQGETREKIIEDCFAPMAHNNSELESQGCEDAEDEELDSLLTMVNSYTGRQQQSAGEDSDQATESPLADECSSKSTSEYEDQDEEEMLISMLKSHHVRQSNQNNDHIENASVKNEAERDSDSERNGVELGSSKKKKSRGLLRSEKQQMASLNRHANMIADLKSDVEVTGVMQKVHTTNPSDGESYGLMEAQEEKIILENDMNCGSKSHSKENPSSKGKVNAPVLVEVEQRRKPARGKKNKGNGKSSNLTCETCGEDFDSRNQLFKHISSTKHAALKGR